MYLFYSNIISGKFHTLSIEESKHCIKVLRLKNGSVIHLTDGRGNLYETRIVDDNMNKCRLEISQSFKEYSKRSFNLHLAVAPTKNLNRYEWFLEKVTEIGIDEITPIICEHSERRKIQSGRLNKIIISAMKQSLKAYCPQLNAETNFMKFTSRKTTSQKFIAYCSKDVSDTLKTSYHPGSNAILLIGPEGDFSEQELEFAIKQGFKPVSLGPSRLRTETAAIMACCSFNFINQEKSFGEVF